MKRTLYYNTVFARTNVIKEWFVNLFSAFVSLPRLLLEVFIRRNFGERYFSLMTAILLFLFLAYYPLFRGFSPYADYGGGGGTWDIIKEKLTWYLFLFAFLAVSIMRYIEIKHSPSVFDFAKFSLSTGEINPMFYKVKVFGKTPNARTISIVLEPLFFLLIGLFLLLFKQSVGVLIIICSICYSLGYYAAYHRGDEYMMDQIDQIICSEEMVKNFDEGRENWTRGFEPYCRTPADPDLRRKMADSFIEDIGYEEVK